MYTYLLVHLFTILFPLGYSFDRKISYYQKWKYLFTSLLIVAAFFIVWDCVFTYLGVWSFNRKYVLGIFIAQLPIEEWLFFITVPFSCIFIYEALNYYIKKDILVRYTNAITLVLVIGLFGVAFIHITKLYTSVTFIFTAIALVLHRVFFGIKYLGRFYISYLVHLIPFFIVNGILTALPVVIYNDEQNLGLKLYTIPIEDAFYSMLLLLLNISIYEYLKARASGNKNQLEFTTFNRPSSYAKLKNNN